MGDSGPKIYKWPNGTTYQGPLLDGQMDGYGILTYPNSNKYIGEFAAGMRHGKGLFIWADGERYEGDFENNNRSGYGIYHYNNGDAYQGDFLDGLKHGEGVYSYSNGNIYRGQYEKGRRHGRGRLEYANGSIYEGQYSNDHKHGKGVQSWPDGRSYEGDFENNEMNGKGTMKWANGDVYIGSFRNGYITGRGTKTIAYKNQRYEGDFVEGQFHGRGKLIEANKNSYEGDYRRNAKHGTGITFKFETRQFFKETWRDDEMIKSEETTIHIDPWQLILNRGIERDTNVKHAMSRRAETEKTPKEFRLSFKSSHKKLSVAQYKLAIKIFAYVDPQSLTKVSCVCKSWRGLFGDNEALWEAMSKQRWKELYNLSRPKLNISWKILYRTKSVIFSKDGMRDSYGTFIWPNGNRYEGEWHESKRQGQGVMLYSNKDVYYGHFEDGRKHKFGIYKFFSGTVYQGYWERGRLHGTAKVIYGNGDVFEGTYYKGEKMGFGMMTYLRGPIKSYIGEWRRGKKEGHGKEITRSGEEIDTIYLNGLIITSNMISDGQEVSQDNILNADGQINELVDDERLLDRKRRRQFMALKRDPWFTSSTNSINVRSKDYRYDDLTTSGPGTPRTRHGNIILMRSNSPLLLQRVKKPGSPYPTDLVNPNGRSAPNSSNKAKRYSIEVSTGLNIKAPINGNTPVKTPTRLRDENNEDQQKINVRSPSKK